MALSNNVIGGINFAAVLLSIPIIGAGIWLTTEPDNACVKILQWPVIILGVLILIVALAGFVGAFWRIPCLLITYLVAMLVLIVLLGSLVGFVFAVTLRGSGRIEPSRAYLEYRLDDFSGWLRRRVKSSFNKHNAAKLLGFCNSIPPFETRESRDVILKGVNYASNFCFRCGLLGHDSDVYSEQNILESPTSMTHRC